MIHTHTQRQTIIPKNHVAHCNHQLCSYNDIWFFLHLLCLWFSNHFENCHHLVAWPSSPFPLQLASTRRKNYPTKIQISDNGLSIKLLDAQICFRGDCKHHLIWIHIETPRAIPTALFHCLMGGTQLTPLPWNNIWRSRGKPCVEHWNWWFWVISFGSVPQQTSI